jgi:hypothetical protein
MSKKKPQFDLRLSQGANELRSTSHPFTIRFRRQMHGCVCIRSGRVTDHCTGYSGESVIERWIRNWKDSVDSKWTTQFYTECWNSASQIEKGVSLSHEPNTAIRSSSETNSSVSTMTLTSSRQDNTTRNTRENSSCETQNQETISAHSMANSRTFNEGSEVIGLH